MREHEYFEEVYGPFAKRGSQLMRNVPPLAPTLVPPSDVDWPSSCAHDSDCPPTLHSEPERKAVGRKDDKGKTPLRLLFSGYLLQGVHDICRVIEYGYYKYGDSNWVDVENGTERYADALMRHATKFCSGEWSDEGDWVDGVWVEGTGLPHLACAATNCLFLLFLARPEEGNHE